MFLIGAIKPISEKILKLVLFLRDCLGEGSWESTKKILLFLYAVGLVAATKTLCKRKEKSYFVVGMSQI